MDKHIETLNIMQSSYAHIRKSDTEWEAIEAAKDALSCAQPENKPCADCSGIIYRQTNSGKIVPADQHCTAKVTPPCYQPDGDGCAYQTNGEGNEPIEKCHECPHCYSDKVRSENKPLTLDELREMGGEPVWVVTLDGTEEPIWEIIVSVGKHGIDLICVLNGVETMDYADFDLYNDAWLAYRSKPEEEKI